MRPSGYKGLIEFLEAYPLMAIRPSASAELLLKGTYAFVAEHTIGGLISDAFDLQIELLPSYPEELPKVRELSGRIPRDGDHHVNGHDDTLCLGSPLSLLSQLKGDASLIVFAEKCLTPYLYATSYKLKNGGEFILGELAHGWPGVLADYKQLFGVDEDREIIRTLSLLGTKKRKANKQPCPCGCGRRLGACRYNRRIAPFRSVAGRGWFRREGEKLGEYLGYNV